MTLDIEKIKAAAMAAKNALSHDTEYEWFDEIVTPSAVLELITRLREAESSLAEEQQDYKEVEAMLHAERDDSQTLRDKVAEQERRIEYLESSEEMFRAERLEHEKVIESLSTLNGIDEYKKDVRDRAKAARKEHDDSIRQTLVGIGILTDEVGYLTCGDDKDQLSLVGEIIFSGTSVKLAQQAAVIEKISEKLKPYPNLAHNTGYFHLQEFFEEILAIPTDSKQVLNDWMREQLGEPVAVVDDAGVIVVCSYSYKPEDKLYKLPECLK